MPPSQLAIATGLLGAEYGTGYNPNPPLHRCYLYDASASDSVLMISDLPQAD
jgi:hypothetical protein